MGVKCGDGRLRKGPPVCFRGEASDTRVAPLTWRGILSMVHNSEFAIRASLSFLDNAAFTPPLAAPLRPLRATRHAYGTGYQWKCCRSVRRSSGPRPAPTDRRGIHEEDPRIHDGKVLPVAA